MTIHGDCIEEMRKMEANSISCILTDPPYGIQFMGNSWDKKVPGKEYWQEALRVCKPGAMMLCFGGSRTYHRLACEIEDAGWEIRDCLMWLYGSGFPKSHNKFGLEGYGTALKPSFEPILLCMKPLDGTFAQNAEKWGQAGINIDDCRIEYKNNDDAKIAQSSRESKTVKTLYEGGLHSLDRTDRSNIKGRWPANLLFEEEAAEILGDPSRFFYCSKASSAERNEGCEKNFHPTVKPLKLLKYLLKLIMPPKDGIILDPFAGSGSTLVAAKQLGYQCIGIELNQEYFEIAKKREAVALLPLEKF